MSTRSSHSPESARPTNPAGQPSLALLAKDLCFGGSFDPPHVGHLIVARAAAEAAGLRRVRLIVAGQSPFKANATPGHLRLEMCRLAVADDPGFVIDDRELGREGKSFTADTAEVLRDELGAPPAWLIGSDLLPTLPRWHRSAELLADPPTLIRLVVAHRAGHPMEVDALPPEVRQLARQAVIVPQIDVSSTMVRDRVAAGRSIRHLVPEAVERLIASRGLYRA